MRLARPAGILAAILAFGVLATTAPGARAHDTGFGSGSGLVIVFGAGGDRQVYGGNPARAWKRTWQYRHRQRVRARQARRARMRAWRRHRAPIYQPSWADRAYWR